MKIQKFRALLCLVLYLFYMPVYAQVPPPSVFPVVQDAGVTRFLAGLVNPQNLPSVSVPTPVNGTIVGEVKQTIQVGGGRTIEVVAKSAPKAAAVAGAFGRFAGKAFPVVSGAVAVMGLARELGYIFKQNPDGSTGVDYVDPSICTANCTGYSIPEFTSFVYPSKERAAQAYLDYLKKVRPNIDWQKWELWSGGSKVYITGRQGSTNADIIAPFAGPLPRAADPVVYVPSDPEAFKRAVEMKVDWPQTSKLPQAIKEVIAAGEPLPLPAPQSITGPASVLLPPTTVKNPDGTTTTKQASKEMTYGPDSVAVKDKTIETVKNPDGTTKSTTTTESEPEPMPSDTPLGALPVLYTPKYKDGLKGVWAQQKQALSNTSLARLLPNLFPTISGSGTIPKFSIGLNLGVWRYGTHDLFIPEYIWLAGRSIVIVTALIAARRAIFGG